MTIPEVTAFLLDDAQRLLAEAGVTGLRIVITGPPRGGPAGPLRVIRQRLLAGGVELTAASSCMLPEKEQRND